MAIFAAAGKNGGFCGSGKMAILAYMENGGPRKPLFSGPPKMPIFGTAKKAAYFGVAEKTAEFRAAKNPIFRTWK